MTASPAARASLVRPLVWLVLALVALLIFTVSGNYDSMGTPDSRIRNQVFVYLVLGTWLVVALLRPAWRPRTPLLGAVILACVAYGLSALTSQRPRLSLEPGLAGLAIALAFIFLTTLLSDPWFRRRLAVLLVMVVAIVGLAYVAAVGFEWVVFYRLVKQVALPPLRPSWTDLMFGSPNLVATFLLVLGPLAVANLARLSKRLWPAVLLALLCAVAVFLTGSRGGYLGAGAEGVVIVVLMALRSDLRGAVRRLLGQVRGQPVLLVPIGLVVLGAVAVTPLVIYRFAQGGDGLRFDLWRSAFAIFEAHPLLGGGPGTWVQLKVETSPPGVSNLILSHAHNLYVQAAAELGIVGLLALGILAVTVIRRLLEGVRRGPRDVHAIAATAGLAAFFAQVLVDNLVNLPYVCLMVMGVVAWVDGGLLAADRVAGAAAPAPGRASRLAFRLGGPVVVVALAALVAVVPTLVRIDRAAALQADGDQATSLRDYGAALAAYDEALSLDPDFTLYSLERAATLARLGRVPEARAQLADAVRFDSVGINLISLATLDLADGDPAAALDHVRLTLIRSPLDGAVALSAGFLAERLGQPQLALDQLATAVALRPSIIALTIFDDPVRSVPKDAIVARARAMSAPEYAALVLAYAGDPATARAELEALPESSTRDTLLAAVIWLGGDTNDAVERLEAMVRRNPVDYAAGAWLAGIMQATNNPAAGVYLRLIRIVQADVAPDLARMVRSRVVSPEESWFAMPGQYPWAMYVRTFGGNLLAPGLTVIGSR